MRGAVERHANGHLIEEWRRRDVLLRATGKVGAHVERQLVGAGGERVALQQRAVGATWVGRPARVSATTQLAPGSEERKKPRKAHAMQDNAVLQRSEETKNLANAPSELVVTVRTSSADEPSADMRCRSMRMPAPGQPLAVSKTCVVILFDCDWDAQGRVRLSCAPE